MHGASRGLVLLGLGLVLASCKDPEMLRADEFLQLEDWPRAIAIYDQVVQERPMLAEARLGLALALAGLERDAAFGGLDSASHWISVARNFAIVERIDTSFATGKDRADALFQASLCWQREGRLPQARHSAQEAQAAFPAHAPSAQFLGTLARTAGDVVNAERWFLHAAAADTGYLPALASLGDLALSEGDPEAAILHWETALQRSPNHPWFLGKVRRTRDSLGLPSP